MQKNESVSALEIFGDLPAQDSTEMDRLTAKRSYQAGEMIYSPTDPVETLFLLKSGRVQLYRVSPSGVKLLIATLEPKSMFGEMPLIGQSMQNTFAQAVEDTQLYLLNRAGVEQAFLVYPPVRLRFLELIGQRLRQAEKRLEEMANKNISARLAGLLLQLAQENSGRMVSGYTHQALAEMLGTYRETITQVLDEFQTTGLIETGRKQITILNPKELQRAAESYKPRKSRPFMLPGLPRFQVQDYQV